MGWQQQLQDCLQIAEVDLKKGIGWLFLHATAFSASALAKVPLQKPNRQTDIQTISL